MLLNWLLLLAITLEIGFVIWYVIMAITLFRSVLKKKQNGLTHAMGWLTVSYILNTLWLIVALPLLPEMFLASKIVLDVYMAVMVTYFMWELDLGERVKKWLKQEE